MKNSLMRAFCTITVLCLNVFLNSVYAQSNSSSTSRRTNIENPSYGNSSRFQVVENENIKSDDEDFEVENQNSAKSKLQKNIAQTRVFDSEKIAQTKSLNIQEFLASNGFLVMTTGGIGSASHLSYKGYTDFCIKVYIDGILANNSTTGEFDWNSIDINSIEKIEIDDAPVLSDTEFAGCIVRITTKNFIDKLVVNTLSASYKNSLFDIWNMNAFYAKDFGKFKLNAATSVFTAKNEFEKPTGKNLDNFSNQANANFGWSVQLFDNANLSGKSFLNYNNLKAHGTGEELSKGIETDISTLNYLKFDFANSILKSQTDLVFNFANVEYINDRKTSYIDNTGFFKTSIHENLEWILNFSATCNFEWLANNFNSNRISVGLGAAKKIELKKFSLEPQLVALFWYNNNAGVKILPRLTMSFEGISLSLFRECVLPTFNQLYWPETAWTAGNPKLNPETGWSASLAFKRNDFPLWAQYKFSYYENKINWTMQSGKYIPNNTADGFYNVVTLGLEQNLFNNILKMSLDATYTSAKLCTTGKQIMWVPQWQAHAGLCIDVWQFIFNLDYSFTGRRWTSNDNTSYYPEFHLLDITLNIKCRDSIETYFKVNNLLNQQVAYHDSYYIPSRKIVVGVKFTR